MRGKHESFGVTVLDEVGGNEENTLMLTQHDLARLAIISGLEGFLKALGGELYGHRRLLRKGWHTL